MKKRYEVGLEKLATTESSVADMQQELIALQPQLEESTKETEAAMVVSCYTICCEHFALNHMQAFNFGFRLCWVPPAYAGVFWCLFEHTDR